MELSRDQEDRIIKKVIEQTLAYMPDVIGSLMQNKANLDKVKKTFFEKYPEFVNYSDIVSSVIMDEEGKDFTKSVEEILSCAVPEIRKRIEISKSLNTVDIPLSSEVNKTYNDSNLGEL